MKSIAQEPRLPKYGALQQEISNMRIGILLNQVGPAQLPSGQDTEPAYKMPTWDDVLELLNKIYNTLDQEKKEIKRKH